MARRITKPYNEYPENQADLIELFEELEVNQELFSTATDEVEGIDKDEYLAPIDQKDAENIRRRGR